MAGGNTRSTHPRFRGRIRRIARYGDHNRKTYTAEDEFIGKEEQTRSAERYNRKVSACLLGTEVEGVGSDTRFGGTHSVGKTLTIFA